MHNAKLELSGPFRAWHGAARQGHLVSPDGDRRRVIVLLGPEGTNGEALERAVRGAGAVLALQSPGILALRQVLQSGDRVAWVHEHLRVLSSAHTVDNGGEPLLTIRAASEVVATVAETLTTLGPSSWEHPGPEPADVLLDGEGGVRVAGFVGPFPRSSAMRAPGGDVGEKALVFRLGVLLAHLVSGVSPGPIAVEADHDNYVRRILVRAMARSGPVVTDRFTDWLRGLLHFTPNSRPALSRVAPGLRVVGQDVGGTTLRAWARAEVDALLDGVESQRDTPAVGIRSDNAATQEISLDLSDAETQPPNDPIFRHMLADFPADDDPTEVEPEAPPTVVGDLSSFVAPSSGSMDGPMPIHVGPPSEAVQKKPTLPDGFLDDPSVSEESHVELTDHGMGTGTDTGAEVAGSGVLRLILPVLWVVSMVVLTGVAVLLLAFLLLYNSGDVVPDGPSLDDVMETP